MIYDGATSRKLMVKEAVQWYNFYRFFVVMSFSVPDVVGI
jgi:hypothetical protein